MSSAFSSIKQGLEEALEFSQGKVSKGVVHKFSAIDVKEVRVKVGMTQNEFASAFGISVVLYVIGKEGIAPRKALHLCF